VARIARSRAHPGTHRLFPCRSPSTLAALWRHPVRGRLCSLSRLAALPDDTLVYCTHEYTLSNLRFACAVEPENPAISNRLAEVTRLRAANAISLPTRIALEKQTNPFLRSAEAAVRQMAATRSGSENLSEEAVFATIRGWKDQF
jgi:hydroxyacylglutathione hydrolase